MDAPRARFRPRDATDRVLAAVAHGAGLLGLTVLGWALAPLVSIPLLYVAGRRRSAYLAGHAGQAALYQIAVVLLQALYLLWLGSGFLSFGGELPGVPDFRVFDLWPEPWVTVVQVIWGLSLLAWPVFAIGTVALAALGALRAGRGQRFWYPLVSGRIRRLAEGAPSPLDPTAVEGQPQDTGGTPLTTEETPV